MLCMDTRSFILLPSVSLLPTLESPHFSTFLPLQVKYLMLLSEELTRRFSKLTGSKHLY